ncbi:response regulator [Deinococcus planocerae]|uniref:response regulator n=1 Tax=Deinococcus planocerae TaxID=1737569 RepID=UPI001FE46265|nr:response regulator [Deinococcus planocerae]
MRRASPGAGESPAELRLLVVDDEQQILELLSLTLGLHGFQVETARSGPEALGAACERGFDVIVMDVLMTPWDGFETVRRLHAALGRGLPPVVFLSGLDRQERVPDLGPDLITAYLVKPFRPSQLVESIRQVAARRPG